MLFLIYSKVSKDLTYETISIFIIGHVIVGFISLIRNTLYLAGPPSYGRSRTVIILWKINLRVLNEAEQTFGEERD